MNPSDEIFTQAAMMSSALAGGLPATTTADVTSWHVGRDDATKKFLAPFFFSGTAASKTSNWPSICSAFKKHGVVVQARADAFEKVAAADLPLRIATAYSSAGLDFDEFTSADLVQVACEDDAGVLSWPIGCTAKNLHQFVEAVRFGAGGDCPTGIAISTASHPKDLEAALSCGGDYVVLRSRAEGLTYQDLICLRRLAEANNQSEKPTTILADFPCLSAKDFFIVAALGAAAISIDRVMQPAIETSAPSQGQSEGMLSSLGIAGLETKSEAPRKSSTLIDQAIAELKAEITRLVLQTGASSMSELDAAMLRTTSTVASKSLGIPAL